jgi:hypothetical protein
MKFRLKTASIIDYILFAVLVILYVSVNPWYKPINFSLGFFQSILNVFLVIYAVIDTFIVILLIAALIIAWLLIHTNSMDTMVKTKKFLNSDMNKEPNKFAQFLNNGKYIVVILLCFYLPTKIDITTKYIGVLYCIAFVLIQIFAYITPQCVAKITKLMLLGKTQEAE